MIAAREMERTEGILEEMVTVGATPNGTVYNAHNFDKIIIKDKEVEFIYPSVHIPNHYVAREKGTDNNFGFSGRWNTVYGYTYTSEAVVVVA